MYLLPWKSLVDHCSTLVLTLTTLSLHTTRPWASYSVICPQTLHIIWSLIPTGLLLSGASLQLVGFRSRLFLIHYNLSNSVFNFSLLPRCQNLLVPDHVWSSTLHPVEYVRHLFLSWSKNRKKFPFLLIKGKFFTFSKISLPNFEPSLKLPQWFPPIIIN